MSDASSASLFSWAELPKEEAEVTFETFEDDEGDYVKPVRVDYPATETRPARAFVPLRNGWVETDQGSE
ncbi:hypothetical protein [Brachybacterium kimchii]|uniref:Uncharacterized protein n=1 Tax=Brachybacterium kimchii TaxID=2942909 RepID=A0ABY4N7Y1_9MICO|nr:hypothetical protein [Brachybacterium kimchii]UQN30647.1 hypothetical protein M4486_04920 [Brachybacterium kimchii]